MALDYYLSMNMNDQSTPILRFYGWEPYCLSLGKHQNSDNIRLDKLEADGFQIVRRPTGGSAILHSEELTYSIIVPVQIISHHELYEIVHVILWKALNQIGYPVELHGEKDTSNYLKEGDATFACFNRPAYMEIKYDHRKLVGSAQKIYKNAILQHGSILIGKKQKEIVEYLNETESVKNQTANYLASNSVCLQEISTNQIDEQRLAKAIINILRISGLDIIGDKTIGADELSEAENYIGTFEVKKIN